MKNNLRLSSLLLSATIAGLWGCVDSNVHGDGSTTTVQGVAATGQAISGGTVNLNCGNGYSTSAITDSDGKWSASVPANDLPCNLKVSGGTPSGTFYSVAQKPSGTATTSNANLTPLTDLATAAALNSADGTKTLEVWFANDSPALRQQVADGIAAATTQLRTALSDAGYTLPPGAFDPFTAAIVAGGASDLYDQILEAYKAALATAGKDYDGARDDYKAGADIPAPGTTPPPSGQALPDDKLGVSFVDQNASHLWLQPATGGISAINGAGDGQVIVRMGDGTENGPDGTVSFNVLPNKLGTYACGDAVGNSKLHMTVTFQGIANPRKTYVSYQDAADPAQRQLLSGYNCSVTLTHVGTFTSQYIYGDDYIEGTFTAKLRQESPDCVGEGNCSPYKELTVGNGKFRINKSGVYTPVTPPVSAGKGILGNLLKEQLAGDYVLKCSVSAGQTAKAYAFHLGQDGSSTFENVALVDSAHAGSVEVDGFASTGNGITVKFAQAASGGNYVVLGFLPDGTFKPNSVHVNGDTFMCYVNSGHSAPSGSAQVNSHVPSVAGALARSQTLACSKGGSTTTQTLTIGSDGSAQIGSDNFAASKLYNIKDDILFGSAKTGSLSYSDTQIVNNSAQFKSLVISFDKDLNTTGVLYGVGLGPNDVSTCTPAIP
ncbi:MAG: hypothetical protein E6Q40_11365 [Cupriavidus sp.]|nr:MAG: hypothetical protein E6Q40_11365 [Cupriavidus sp.]